MRTSSRNKIRLGQSSVGVRIRFRPPLVTSSSTVIHIVASGIRQNFTPTVGGEGLGLGYLDPHGSTSMRVFVVIFQIFLIPVFPKHLLRFSSKCQTTFVHLPTALYHDN